MARYAHDDVLDAPLLVIKNNATRMVACSTQPADFAGVAAVALADVAVAATDLVIADGTTGRKLTVAAKSAVAIDTTGDYAHVALVDDTGERLLWVTTGTGQPLTVGNPANFPAWTITFPDPV